MEFVEFEFRERVIFADILSVDVPSGRVPYNEFILKPHFSPSLDPNSGVLR